MIKSRVVALVVCVLLSPSVLSKPRIDRRVTAGLRQNTTMPVIVQLEINSALDKVDGEFPRSGPVHGQVIQRLQAEFYQAYEDLRTGAAFRLKKTFVQSDEVHPLWLVGGFAMNADAEMIEYLRSSPKVRAVQFDAIEVLPPFWLDENPDKDDATYGLKKIGVYDARAANPGITGKGVTVGIIDTGIDPSHPDLEGKVKLWKDFVSNGPQPYDDNSHGTHVAGTIAGGNKSGTAIGVAPEASLVIAKVFSAEGSSRTSILVEAMQWMTDPDQNPATWQDVPFVVSNSWGGGNHGTDEDPLFKGVATWRKLGIFPCFAAGNEGPGEGSLSAPGMFPLSFAVGATDVQDVIAPFSSRGPGRMMIGGKLVEVPKPNVSAPGVKVLSSVPGGKYASYSGTSMATPHVAGVVALLAQLYPEITAEGAMQLLEKSADDLGDVGFDGTYGYGRINFLKMLP